MHLHIMELITVKNFSTVGKITFWQCFVVERLCKNVHKGHWKLAEQSVKTNTKLTFFLHHSQYSGCCRD